MNSVCSLPAAARSRRGQHLAFSGLVLPRSAQFSQKEAQSSLLVRHPRANGGRRGMSPALLPPVGVRVPGVQECGRPQRAPHRVSLRLLRPRPGDIPAPGTLVQASRARLLQNPGCAPLARCTRPRRPRQVSEGDSSAGAVLPGASGSRALRSGLVVCADTPRVPRTTRDNLGARLLRGSRRGSGRVPRRRRARGAWEGRLRLLAESY